MTWPVAFAIVGGFFALALAAIKITTTIWGGEIKKACKEKFKAYEGDLSEILDTGALRREGCMETFKVIKDNITQLMMQNAVFKKEIENIIEKIIELRIGQDKMNSKIDKLMFLLPKRSGNHKND